MGGHFDVPKLKQEKEKLEEIIKQENFWDNLSKANATCQQLKSVNKVLKNYQDLLDNIDLLLELFKYGDLDENDVNKIFLQVQELEINTLLNGEFDDCNCYLEIHPGAGGTESCDWALMLLRMYQKFFDKNDYTYRVIEKQDGEEAGIKSVTLFIEGEFPYGYLKNEMGVHRLVRISPFDANKRRHTSFASVSVIPEFNKETQVEIREEDLKIDVYHSSGAGGQSVNTANSAVRITHLPTKTVVTCQTERSQLRNKEIALKLLKNKIYQQMVLKQEKQLQAITGEVSNIDFGSQIRSYVLEPYKLVKDNRSNFQSTDPLKILDGDLKPLIESVLKIK